MPKKFLTKEGLDNVLAAVETRYGPLLTHNHDSKYLGLTATAADSDKLDGRHLSEIVPWMYYDTSSGPGGILIATDLLSIHDNMTLVEIKGNAYGEGIPIDSVLQFYNHVPYNSIIQCRAINNGKNIGPFIVFVHDGVVKIWIPRVGSFVTYYVTVRTNTSPLHNHVTGITHSPMPTEGVSRLVTVTPSNAVRAQGTATQFIMGDGSLKPLTDITDSIDGKVNKAGDTMTGQLILSSGFDHKLILNNTDTETNYQQISFRQNNVEYGWLGTYADKALRWNGYKLLNEHNYPDFLNNTYSVKSHTHANLYQPADTRSVPTKPNDYNAKLAFTGMKNSSAIGGNGGSLFMNGFGWRGWSDHSGGNAWEIFGNNSELFCRNGSTETWGAWNKFLTDKNYQSLLDTRYFHAGNMGSGSGLNADMVDGYHAGMANGNAAVFAAFPAFGTLISQGYLAGSYASDGYPNDKYFKALVKWCIDNYPNGGNLIGAAIPNSVGLCMIHLYPSRMADGFPNYCSGMYTSLDGITTVFGTEQGVWKWNMGYWEGTASKAAILSQTKTLWGQPFNGSGNVSGNMSGVGNVVSSTGAYELRDGTTNPFVRLSSGGKNCYVQGYQGRLLIGGATGGNYAVVDDIGNVGIGIGSNAPAYPLDVNGTARVSGGIISNSTNGCFMGNAANGLGSGHTGGLFYAYGANPLYFYTNSEPRMIIDGAGNVGIGTPTPAYPLDVKGNGRFATGLIVGTVPSGANVPMLGIYSQSDIVTDRNVTAQNGLVDTLLVTAQGMIFKLSNSIIIDTADGPEAGSQAIPFAKVYVKEIHLGGATFTYDEATDSVICDKTIASKAGVSCLVTDGTSTANPGTGGDISTPIG